MEDQYLNNWEKLPKDVKLLIINKLSDRDRFDFCQTNRSINTFCHTYKLTADDKILEANPTGQLIDTTRKQADLIKRGFATVFSLVLNETPLVLNNESRTNIPEDLKVLKLVFGVNKGTVFFENITNHNSKFYNIHLSIPGIPPIKGELIKFLFVHCRYQSGNYFDAIHLKEDDNITEIINTIYKTEPHDIYEELLENPKYIKDLLAGKRVITKEETLAIIYELPCP